MHVYHLGCEAVLAESSYQRQQQQVQDRHFLPTSASTADSMDAQRTLAFAVHTAVMGSVLTSAQKQAFVGGGLPCIHACDPGASMDFSSRTSTPGPAKAGCRAVLQQQVGAHLEDSTSPLSSSSLVLIDAALTPCAADSISVARLGCKRTFDAVEQYQQVVPLHQLASQQQQAMTLAQLRQQTAQQSTKLKAKHAVALIKQRHAQQQRQQQQQQLCLQQQIQQTLSIPSVGQQQQQPSLQALLAAGRYRAAVSAAKVASVGYTAVPQQQQQLLPSQGSGISTGSSFSSATAAPCITASWVVPQYVQQQQQQVPLLGSASSVTTTSSTNSGSSCASLFASYLQQQQQRRLPKRAATQAAVAARLSATTTTQARAQQQRVLLQPLAAASSSNNLHNMTAVGSYSTLFTGSSGSDVLTWAGQVLNCQLQDAYLLAQHIFQRVAGRLDDMLLISLGVTLPVDNVTMLVSLWVATKLEGHRRQVAGCSKLAAALQLLPWAVTSVELHMMQLLNWQPYAGWVLRPQNPSCAVTEQ